MDIHQRAALISEHLKDRIKTRLLPKILVYGSDRAALEELALIDCEFVTHEKTDLNCPQCIFDLRKRWKAIVQKWE